MATKRKKTSRERAASAVASAKRKATTSKRRFHKTSAKSKAEGPAKILFISSSGMSAEMPMPTTLEQWWALIGGYIERVRIRLADGSAATLIVDEEGSLKGLPINPVASALYGDYISGPAALLTGKAHRKFGR